MKRTKIILTSAILLFSLTMSLGQASQLIITPTIKLPKDSLIKVQILNSLEIFLKEKNQDMYNSAVVEKQHYEEYKDFFDIFKNIEKSRRYNDTSFFKCYLSNLVLQPDNSYRVSLSYFGSSPNKEIIHRLSVTMIAKQDRGVYKFYCPFIDNTKHWKSEKIGTVTFYYEYDFNPKVAKDFEVYNRSLAKKLKIKPLELKYYKCRDIQEVYRIMGIDYDININGNVRSGSFDTKNKVFLAGTNSEQYKHDLTHGYMSLIFPDSVRNWAAEEGYNIYTTDYWGESSEQVFKYLTEYAKANPDISLLEVFEKDIILKHPISIKCPIAAVIMRKVEKEYGFEKVLQLISCGETDDNFFSKLQELTGITKENFDQTVRAELTRYSQN
jgi:hypothetical protein